MKYLANIWPRASESEKIASIKDILSSFCTVERINEITLNKQGLRNYMAQIYKDEKWNGSYWNHFHGGKVKVENCYQENRNLWVIQLECNDPLTVIKAKDEVRKFCQIEKHSIHTSDSEEEYYRMSELLYNANSIWLMNHCIPYKNIRFMYRLEQLAKAFTKASISTNKIIIVSDAILALYNQGSSSRLSFISEQEIPRDLLKYNDEEYKEQAELMKEEILKKENQVFFWGFHFTTLELFEKIKRESDQSSIRNLKDNKF